MSTIIVIVALSLLAIIVWLLLTIMNLSESVAHNSLIVTQRLAKIEEKF
jgi:hypothetical protein